MTIPQINSGIKIYVRITRISLMTILPLHFEANMTEDFKKKKKKKWLNSWLQLKTIWASSQMYFSIGSQINGVYTCTTDWYVSEKSDHKPQIRLKRRTFSDFLQCPPANRTEWTPQVTVPSRDKMPHPQNMKGKERRRRRRGYLKTWFGYGHDLMLNEPSCTGRRRQWHRSKPNTPL